MTIKAIVFDLWNTLAYNDTPENPMVHLGRRLGIEVEDYERVKEIEKAFMLQKFQSVLDAANQICEKMGIEPTNELIRDLLDIWDFSKIKFSFFPDVVPVLEKLREKYKIGLMSNTDCFSVREFFAEYKKYFDAIAFSYELGLLKPDPAMFTWVLEKLEVSPKEALIVGDNLQDDVRAAEALGMHAVLMKRDPEKFRFVPSWIEKGSYPKMINSLDELEKFL